MQICELIDELQKEHYPFIFLGGIHGVGKSFACEHIFSKAGYSCVTASSLIKSYGIHSDQNKKVKNIADNQEVLLKQLEVEKLYTTKLLLDGHYCLVNDQKNVESISVEVFRQISPSMFILLKDEPQIVANRLNKRDGSDWDTEFITNFQKLEEQHAQSLAQDLCIPFRVVEVASYNG